MQKWTRQQQPSLGGGRGASSLRLAATLGHLRLFMQRSIERWAIPPCSIAVLILLLVGLKADRARSLSSSYRNMEMPNAAPAREEDACPSTMIPASWTA